MVHEINRRAFLRTSTAASVTIATVGAVSVTIAAIPSSDPCVAFFDRWEGYVGRLAAAPTAEAERELLPTGDAILGQIVRGEIPPATSPEGAAAALRAALNLEAMDVHEVNLIGVALAYLEGRA